MLPQALYAANEAATSHSGKEQTSVFLLAIGLIALAAGVLVYLTDRNASSVALLPGITVLAKTAVFGSAGGWLPSLLHPFAFSLFGAAACPANTAPPYWICVAWFSTNALFEIAQHPGANAAVAEAITDILGPIWLTHMLSNYVLHGTFDVLDLVAAAAGALAAAAVLRLVHRGG